MTDYEFGAILPYGPRLDKNGVISLSAFSRAALEDGLRLYNKGLFQKFLLCGENTFGRFYPSTTVLMRDFLLENGVPEDRIVMLPNKNHTAAQIGALAKWQKVHEAGRIIVVTFLFHRVRTLHYVEKLGLNAYVLPIDERYVPDTIKDALHQFEKAERPLRFLSAFDERGIIPTILSPIIGPRINDVDVEGRFINDLARRVLIKHLIRRFLITSWIGTEGS